MASPGNYPFPPGARILFVKPGGGISQQLFALDHFALVAARKGAQVGMLGPFPSHPDASQIHQIRAYPGLGPKPLGNVVSLAIRLKVFRESLREFQPDLIHVRNHFGAAVLPLLREVDAPGAKMVLDVRTQATRSSKHRLARLLRPVNGWGYDHVFALNQTILNTYFRTRERSSLLPLGFDDAVFRPGSDNARYEPGERLRCIYYGSMNRVRGLETLVRGLVEALDTGVDLEAHFVGEGSDKERVASTVPASYADRILFHPFSDQQSLAARLRQSHLGLAYVPETPVFDPNLPLKTVEMLASGLPVLGTRTQGNREVVRDGDNGFLVGDSPEAICEGLVRAARGGGPMSVPPETRAAQVEAYSWTELAENRLFPVYSSLHCG